jgi:TolB-like protein
MKKNLILFLVLAFNYFSNAQSIKVAILDFENTSGIAKYDGLGKAMSSMLISDIEANVSPKRLQLVERAQIQKILKEQNFQASSAVDKSSSVKAGKLLGVKYLLVGDIYILNDLLVINARLTDTETGDIKFSKKQEGKLVGWLTLKTNIAKDLASAISMPFAEPTIADKEVNVATLTTFGNAVNEIDDGNTQKGAELITTIKEFSPDFKYVDELEKWLNDFNAEQKKYESDLVNKAIKSLSVSSPNFAVDVTLLLTKLNFTEHKSKTALELNDKIRNLKYDFNKGLVWTTNNEPLDAYLLEAKFQSFLHLKKYDEAVTVGKILLNKYPRSSLSTNASREIEKIVKRQKIIEKGKLDYAKGIIGHYSSCLMDINEFCECSPRYLTKNSVYKKITSNGKIYYSPEPPFREGDEFYLINVIDSNEYNQIKYDFTKYVLQPLKGKQEKSTISTPLTLVLFFNFSCTYLDIQSAESIQEYFKLNYKSSEKIWIRCNSGETSAFIGENIRGDSCVVQDIFSYFDKKIAFIKSIENKRAYLLRYVSDSNFNYSEYKDFYYKYSNGCMRGTYIECCTQFKSEDKTWTIVGKKDNTDYVTDIYLPTLFDNADFAARHYQFNEETILRTSIVNKYNLPPTIEKYQLMKLIEAQINIGDFEHAEKTKIILDKKYPGNNWIGFSNDGFFYGHIEN